MRLPINLFPPSVQSVQPLDKVGCLLSQLIYITCYSAASQCEGRSRRL